MCDCGYNFETRAAGTVKAVVRPWIRYWARMFDLIVFGLALGSGLGVVAPDLFSGSVGDQLFGVALLLAWVFVEALLLSSFGTTPGKWLFRVRLTRATGPMSYSAALGRSVKVWVQGLAAGLPIISVVALIYAHTSLTRDSITAWDKDGGFVVTHDKVGAVRVAVAVLVFLLVIVLIAIDRMNGRVDR